MALGRSLMPHLRRPLVAMGHALAIAIAGAQAELPVSMTLGRRLLKELRRPLVALRHAPRISSPPIDTAPPPRPGQRQPRTERRAGRRARERRRGARSPPAFAHPHDLTRLPLRRRHPARRLVALPVRTLELGRAVVHGAAAGAQPIRVVLLGSRVTHACAHVTDAVHGGGGRGRVLECTVQRNDVNRLICV